jgi:hypothetical protein
LEKRLRAKEENPLHGGKLYRIMGKRQGGREWEMEGVGNLNYER